MLDKRLPCCFTSMQQDEANKDSRALTSFGADVMLSECNRFRSLVPIRDFDAGPDLFYHTNYYLTCFQGRAGNSVASSSHSGADS